MDDPSLRSAMTAFFDAFVVAFRTFDGAEIARRYQAPYVALHDDGSIDSFATATEIAEYFQAVVDEYHGRGCRSCGWRDLEVVPVGRQSALATVTWDLLGDDGKVLASWRESYNLMDVDGVPRIFASVDHV